VTYLVSFGGAANANLQTVGTQTKPLLNPSVCNIIGGLSASVETRDDPAYSVDY
jgi:hypothetical protein